MEYEIYYLCNLIGLFLVLLIILFHFVDADSNKVESTFSKSKESFGETNGQTRSGVNE